MKKKNCWEIKDCGRGPGGRLVPENGKCSIFKAGEDMDIEVGRGCWKVRTRDDNGKLVPNWARQDKNCINCGVMDRIRIEEGELTL